MKYLLIIPILIAFITGCGSLDKPVEHPNTAGIAIDVLTKNKENIEHIKNRTADDIELGHTVRKAILDKSFTDENVGAIARKVAYSQPTMPKEEMKEDVKDLPGWLKWLLIGMAAVLLLNILMPLMIKRK